MNLLTKMRSWSWSLGIMLCPSTRTGCTTKPTIRMAITPAKITSRSSERNSLHRSPESEPATRVDEMSSIILMSLSSSGAMPTNLSLFINRHLTAPYSRLIRKILRRLRLVNEGVFGRRADCGLRIADCGGRLLSCFSITNFQQPAPRLNEVIIRRLSSIRNPQSMRDRPLQRCVNLSFQPLAEQKRLHIVDQKLLVLRIDRAQPVMVD